MVLTIVLCGLPIKTFAQSVEQVVNKYLGAIGGHDNFKAVETVFWRENVELNQDNNVFLMY